MWCIQKFSKHGRFTDADYKHARTVCKDFKIKNLGEYHDLYVQSKLLAELMYLRTFEICVLKYINLTLLVVFLHQD